MAIVGCDSYDNLPEPNNEDVYKYYDTSNGLASNTVYSLFEDNQGNIWIGTSSGISVFNGSSIINFSSPDIIDGEIIAIGQDFNGYIWVANENGYSFYDGQDWFTEYSFGIISFHLDNFNNFWIGTSSNGLLRYNSSEIVFIFGNTCDFCLYVTDIVSDADGTIWYTTLGGLGHVLPNESVDWIDSSSGIPSDFLISISYINDWNQLYVGDFNSGIMSSLRMGEFEFINLPVGDQTIWQMSSNLEGLYIATEGALLFYDGVVIRSVSTPKNDTSFYSVLVDSNQNVWIGTGNNGVIKLTPSNTL